MKKFFLLTALLLFVGSFIITVEADAQGRGKQARTNFVDADGDGVCDNFVDADGDGVCDHCVGTREGNGNGRRGNGMRQRNFIDADGDGVCDNTPVENSIGTASDNQEFYGKKGRLGDRQRNFVDADADGMCDNRANNAQRNNFADEDGDGVCDNYGTNAVVYHAYPNPFTESTTLKFSIPTEGSVSAAIYDYSGNLIATIYDGTLAAGTHEFTFTPDGIEPGRYYFKLTYNDVVKTKPILYSN